MKIAIIYSSQTGFTQKYAQWLKEAFGDEATLFTLKEAKKSGYNAFDSFDAIIYGGWCCAGSVNGLGWFKSNIMNWNANGKKIAIWATGGSPIDNPDIEVAFKQMLTEEQHKAAKLFYCQGGYDYDKMSRGNKILMKMFVSMLKKQKDEKSQSMAKMIATSYDITDKKYIEPIVKYIKG